MLPYIKNFQKKFDGNDEEEEMSLEKQQLLQSIEDAKNEINRVYHKFDYVTDQYLIDSYIYELKALQLKYEYLLKKAKKM